MRAVTYSVEKILKHSTQSWWEFVRKTREDSPAANVAPPRDFLSEPMDYLALPSSRATMEA